LDEEIRENLQQEIRQEKASGLWKWIERHHRQVFMVIAILFIFSVFALFQPELTARGIKKVIEGISRLHESLAEPRFSTYKYLGMVIFSLFMFFLIRESAKARSIVIMPARSPDQKLYVRIKPLVGIRLPFVKMPSKIKSKIIETEYGWVVYPSEGLYNARWNGQKHFIPKHARLSFGNTWVVAATPPGEPLYIEKVETAKGPVSVEVYEWEFDPLGNLLAEKAQKRIETLENSLKIIEKELEEGWKLADKIATDPEEFFDKIKAKGKKDALETIQVVGSTVFKEVAATMRQAYKHAQAAQKSARVRREEEV